MICDNCRKRFVAGNQPNGIPNGVLFKFKTGKKIKMCADCIIELEKMNDEEKLEFLKKLGVSV